MAIGDCSRALASTLSRLAGNQTGSSLWREKIVPRKFLSYISFAGTSRSTVIFQSVCTDTSDLELVIGDRFLGTLKTPLEPVNVHFRQHVVATIVIAVETWRVSSFNKS